MGANPLLGRWLGETVHHPDDAHLGARITQLTSQTTMATSIYCEEPYCSASCNRLVALRGHNTALAGPCELWVIDLETSRSVLVDDDAAIEGCAKHAYTDYFFYTTCSSGHRELRRLCLSTLAIETACRLPPSHPGYSGIGGMSPDDRYVVSRRPAPESSQVVVLDLSTGEETRVAEGRDMFNPHPHFDRMRGETILVQHNRGQGRTADGRPLRPAGDAGATLFLVRRDGSERMELPIARPHLAQSISGHEAWVKGEPEFVFSLGFADANYEQDGAAGNLVAYRIGDAAPRLLADAPDLYFGHVSTSFCGRYWLCDAWPKARGRCDLAPDFYVGSTRTHRFAKLCSLTGGWPNYETGHAHPYLTADNRYAIYGSMQTGMPQVFSAELPDGLLASLG